MFELQLHFAIKTHLKLKEKVNLVNYVFNKYKRIQNLYF
jgi:hypothetical protein